jgi:hypothetical protein
MSFIVLIYWDLFLYHNTKQHTTLWKMHLSALRRRATLTDDGERQLPKRCVIFCVVIMEAVLIYIVIKPSVKNSYDSIRR